MDGNRFDAISRVFGHRTTRRATVAALIGALGGATLADEAGAMTCRPGGYHCTRHGQCCTRKCEVGPLVRGMARNRRQRCACENGTVLCGTKCITLGTEQNCANCGDRCRNGEVCRAGQCRPPGNQGAVCETDSDCASSLICDQEVLVCESVCIGPGKPCTVADDNCCITFCHNVSGLGEVCLGADGDSCGGNEYCQAGLTCNGGFCEGQ